MIFSKHLALYEFDWNGGTVALFICELYALPTAWLPVKRQDCFSRVSINELPLMRLVENFTCLTEGMASGCFVRNTEFGAIVFPNMPMKVEMPWKVFPD